jgi:hypothetical protein
MVAPEGAAETYRGEPYEGIWGYDWTLFNQRLNLEGRMSTTNGHWRRAAAQPGPPDTEVQDFLDRFAHAMTAGDGKAIARMWAVPALVLGDDLTQPVNTSEEAEEFFGGAKDLYNKRGITDTRPEIFGLAWITDRIALVDVRWPHLDQTGKEIGEEASSYVLRREDAGELKLQAAIMRGEAA